MTDLNRTPDQLAELDTAGDTTATNRFWQDSTRMVFEETSPGRLRGVTAWDGTRYVQDQTVSKKYWETLRGPLVEVPDPGPIT